MRLLIGSYAAETEPGIYLCSFEAGSAAIQVKKSISGIENPSYLTVSADCRTIFAVSESKTGNEGRLSSFLADGDQLHPAESLSYEGAGSCFVFADCKHAFIANYRAGSITVIQIAGPDSMSLVQTVDFEGSGPNKERQEQAHIHAVKLSPDGRYLYCTDLGADRLYRFHYDPQDINPLTPCEPHYTGLPPGSGPRHFTFARNNPWFYLVSELSAEVFRFPMGESLYPWFEKQPLTEPGYDGEREAADIQIHPNGRYLYLSNRGDANEIVVFSIDPVTGGMTFIQRISAEGSSPRSLLISPDGKHLVCANEKGNNVTVFRIESGGMLQFTGNELKVNEPTCLKWL